MGTVIDNLILLAILAALLMVGVSIFHRKAKTWTD